MPTRLRGRHEPQKCRSRFPANAAPSKRMPLAAHGIGLNGSHLTPKQRRWCKRSCSSRNGPCARITKCRRWAGQRIDRAVTAISPLTRSLERAATLFRTRPLACHHPLTGNWDGSLISTRSHWLISSRTTEANASRFSAQIAKRWEPGLASNGVMVTIGFTCPGLTFWQRLAITAIESRWDAFGDGFSGAAALWIILGKTG